ncbi:hypothetical protein LTS14_005071 [Recurvomyces mirabilis]|uniref:uncharacterized protein n=1 Tax=Recurvomyces mirabilis TaxID=574656 RepID=UPI002DDFC728|nr:hypothetical protein LTS14_005071 [Recurvomyces mirabilis]
MLAVIDVRKCRHVGHVDRSLVCRTTVALGDSTWEKMASRTVIEVTNSLTYAIFSDPRLRMPTVNANKAQRGTLIAADTGELVIKGPKTLVHDLWALRLQKLQHRVSYESETETETQSQFYSSQSEGETSATESSRRTRGRSQTGDGKISEGTPNVLDTLTLCYTGILLLREPVTLSDIHHWCQNGELLYHRAAKEIPLGMRERLPATYQDLLDPQPIGKPEKLHATVLEGLRTMRTAFGMAFPPVNHVLVLHRWTRDLALPIEVYAATTRLARVLKLDFAFEVDYRAGARDVMLRYPEIRLMSLLVVATKLLFPVDDIDRYPSSSVDVSALRMDWTAWTNAQSNTSRDEQQPDLASEDAMNYAQKDVLDAAEHQLDQYMDWFERDIASEENRERGRADKEADFRRTMFRMFPADRSAVETPRLDDPEPAELIAERLRQTQTLLTPKQIVVSEQEADRIGSFYRRTRTVDELSGAALVLFGRASRLVGSSLGGMVKAVSLIEEQVKRQEERLRRDGYD